MCWAGKSFEYATRFFSPMIQMCVQLRQAIFDVYIYARGCAMKSEWNTTVAWLRGRGKKITEIHEPLVTSLRWVCFTYTPTFRFHRSFSSFGWKSDSSFVHVSFKRENKYFLKDEKKISRINANFWSRVWMPVLLMTLNTIAWKWYWFFFPSSPFFTEISTEIVGKKKRPFIQGIRLFWSKQKTGHFVFLFLWNYKIDENLVQFFIELLINYKESFSFLRSIQ